MDIRNEYHNRTRAISHRGMVARLTEKMIRYGQNPANVSRICADERTIWLANEIANRRANSAARIEIEHHMGGGYVEYVRYAISELRTGYYRVERSVEFSGGASVFESGDLYLCVSKLSGHRSGQYGEYTAVSRAATRKFLAILTELPDYTARTARTVWCVEWRGGREQFKSRRGAIAFARRVKRGDV